MIPSQFKPTFAIRKLVSDALQRLPRKLQQAPWTQEKLNHGTSLLDTDEALDSYLAAYG